MSSNILRRAKEFQRAGADTEKDPESGMLFWLSLSHDMCALTARSMAATEAVTRSLGLHGQEVHMGAHYLRLETASFSL